MTEAILQDQRNGPGKMFLIILTRSLLIGWTTFMNILRLASVFSLRLACAEIISADYCLNSKLIRLGSAQSNA